MSDNDQAKSQATETFDVALERAKLELERARLQLEVARHQNETTRTYLERWRIDVQPVHEHLLKSREMANGHVRSAIQMLFLLNGGALVAFPAFAQIFDENLNQNLSAMLISYSAFISGLVLTATTTLLAYLAFDADCVAIRNREEYTKLGLNSDVSTVEKKQELEAKRETAERNRAKYHRVAVNLGYAGLALAVLALASFVAGTIFAARTISA